MSELAKVTPFDPEKRDRNEHRRVRNYGQDQAVAVAFSEVGDFELGPAGQISTFAFSHHLSGHFIVWMRQHATQCLVELPEGTDLSQASFVYSQQYAEARRAALMPFDTFIAAASDIVPPLDYFPVFHRSLRLDLGKPNLAQLPEVWSLSEPDYLTNIAVARMELGPGESAGTCPRGDALDLPPANGRSLETVVIKPRSEAVLAAEACHRAFPRIPQCFLVSRPSRVRTFDFQVCAARTGAGSFLR